MQSINTFMQDKKGRTALKYAPSSEAIEQLLAAGEADNFLKVPANNT